MKTTREQEERKELIKILKVAKEGGYKTYIHNECTFGYITNGSDVLYIQSDYFWGWNLSFVYKPSKENGSGRRCCSNLSNVDLEIIEKAFKVENRLANDYQAKKYKNSQEWHDSYYNKDSLIEIEE